jgi:hypothetical protein
MADCTAADEQLVAETVSVEAATDGKSSVHARRAGSHLVVFI